MSDLLQELYGHQAWADSVLWQALAAQPGALDDRAIRERLHHIHLVQRLFLWTSRGDEGELTPAKVEDIPDIRVIMDDVRRYHDEAIAHVSALSVARRAEPLNIAWFKDAPVPFTREQALMQCVMHSQYHRGQNATRLRELGGSPPITDFILWLYRDKPPARWY
ncbi:MAG TPA: DinB family protein [Vicinamibacterales bacterium]|jgi:uncharacterized damage-inducible protein DinB|nr:DinB family protein [Vicinamibacterales bacterium]